MSKEIKPDGYVSPRRDNLMKRDGYIRVAPYQWRDHVPVCLVPPELLEWVEDMRHRMRFDDGVFDFLRRDLNRIWPEKL